MEGAEGWKEGRIDGKPNTMCPRISSKRRRKKLLNDKVLAIILMKNKEMGDFLKFYLPVKCNM